MTFDITMGGLSSKNKASPPVYDESEFVAQTQDFDGNVIEIEYKTKNGAKKFHTVPLMSKYKIAQQLAVTAIIDEINMFGLSGNKLTITYGRFDHLMPETVSMMERRFPILTNFPKNINITLNGMDKNTQKEVKQMIIEMGEKLGIKASVNIGYETWSA